MELTLWALGAALLGVAFADASARWSYQAEQERVWAELPAWNRQPDVVRRALTKAHTAAGEPLARFVGLAAYESRAKRRWIRLRL